MRIKSEDKLISLPFVYLPFARHWPTMSGLKRIKNLAIDRAHSLGKKVDSIISRPSSPKPPSAPANPGASSASGTTVSQPPVKSSSFYPTIVVDPSRDQSHGGLVEMASIGFQAFKTILTAVRAASDAFPPLKSLSGGLLGLIDIMEVRTYEHCGQVPNLFHVCRRLLRIGKIAQP
jgi:hypothetical protein